jgi:hypothetical protein
MISMPGQEVYLRVKEVTTDEVKKLLSSSEGLFESAVGHEDTARLLTKLLGVEVRAERKQVTLTPNAILVVFQLLSRLPEGRVLTEEELSKIPYKFFVVEVC